MLLAPRFRCVPEGTMGVPHNKGRALFAHLIRAALACSASPDGTLGSAERLLCVACLAVFRGVSVHAVRIRKLRLSRNRSQGKPPSPGLRIRPTSWPPRPLTKGPRRESAEEKTRVGASYEHMRDLSMTGKTSRRLAVIGMCEFRSPGGDAFAVCISDAIDSLCGLVAPPGEW